MTSYVTLGVMLATARQKAGLHQRDVARQANVSQQTLSRWEQGLSRPNQKQIEALAGILSIDFADLLIAAGFTPPTEPSATFVRPFPLGSLGEEEFETFTEHFLAFLHPNAKVHRVGSRGHDQEGTDVEVALQDGSVESYQCKRHSVFGPEKVAKAVAEHTWKADRKFIVLARTASPQARKEIKKYSGWDIWDVQDISTTIRTKLSVEAQCRLVDTFFKGQRLALIGQDEIGPWQTVEEFFAPFQKSESAFNHQWSLVGRSNSLDTLTDALLKGDKSVITLTGSGGLGKSRLLRAALEVVQRAKPGLVIRMLSPTEQATNKSLLELSQQPKILVVDDAHDREDLGVLFQFVANKANKTKLLLSLRPYGSAVIQSQAATFSLSDEIACVDLEALTLEESTELARQVLQAFNGPTEYAENIAKATEDCPLATVLGAQVVARDNIVIDLAKNEAAFRRTLFGKFRDAIAGDFGSRIGNTTVKKLLRILALLQPFHHEDRVVATTAKEIEGLAEVETKIALRFLADAGVLFSRGERFRLSPDLLADFIIEESCIGIDGSSTGYVESVFNAAGYTYAENILTNIAKLDWRRSNADTTNSRLLNGVWALLKPETEYNDRHINAVRSVAYYQPRLALKFVEEQIRDGRFVTQLPKILKNVAYNLSSIDAAAELLWEIGKRDKRPTNQHPDHAIRILSELAAVEVEKPRAYNEKIVQFALGLAKRDSEWSYDFTPFDILKGVMQTEGHTTMSQGDQIVMKPYAVSPQFVRQMRAEVVDATILLLRHPSSSVAVKAAKFLRSALQAPFGILNMTIGSELRAQWLQEFAETLEKVKSSVRATPLPLLVSVEVAKSVSWLSKHSVGAARAAASDLLKMMPNSLDYRTLLTLVDGFGHLLLDGQSAEGHQKRWEEYLNAVMNDIIREYPEPRALITYLDGKLRTIKEANLHTEGSAYVMVNKLIFACEPLAEEIVKALFTGEFPRTSYYGNPALSMILRSNPDKGRDYSEKLMATGRDYDKCVVGGAYGNLNGNAFEYNEFDLETLKKILSCGDSEIVNSAISAIRAVAIKNVPSAMSLIRSLKPGLSSSVIDNLLTLLADIGPIKFETVQAEDVLHLLTLLDDLRELDGYWVETFLSNVSLKFPEILCDFFMKRVERAARDEDWAIRPCNYGPYADVPLKFKETDIYPTLTLNVIEWMKIPVGDENVFAHHSTLFFNAAFGPFDESMVALFDAWLDRCKPTDLTLIGKMVEHAPNAFCFQHQGFVEKFLEKCKNVDVEIFNDVTSSLFASAVSGIKHGAPGKPFPEDEILLAGATKALESLQKFSPAYKLYSSIKEYAESNIERSLRDRRA